MDLWDLEFALLKSELAYVQYFLTFSLQEWKYIFCAIVCWKNITCFLQFNGVTFKELALSFRRDFELV